MIVCICLAVLLCGRKAKAFLVKVKYSVLLTVTCEHGCYDTSEKFVDSVS